MNESVEKNEIIFVYDGECPLCKRAAMVLKIKQEFGTLRLLNARELNDAPILAQINERGLDLDAGMVIYAGRHFYHGKDALKFMARYAENEGFFNLFNKVLFRFEALAKIAYPWMRGTRNWLLRRRNITPIDNLQLRSQAIFKSIFADDWQYLPPVLKKHYSNHPYSNEVNSFEGTLDVMCAGPIKFFAGLFWLLGGVPPHNEKNVAVRVQFASDENSLGLHVKRIFLFSSRKAYRFHSRMIPTGGNELVEIMRFGLGWRLNCVWQDGRVKLQHRGYVLHLFGHFIPLPLTLLLGSGNAQEVAVDEHTFDVVVAITHPWWGKIYEYKGRFRVNDQV